jgi:hypothetical protein
MPRSSVQVGALNPNRQKLLTKTDRTGTDHNQYVWEIRCEICGHEYGANGSDFHHRKCPACQGGARGIE